MKGRIALVTGASRGIGAAIADVFKERGAEVMAPTREELNLASRASVKDYCDRLKRPVDILVNNAGINVLAGLGGLRPETWDDMIRVNMTAPLELAQRLSVGMAERGWGRILNISSIFSMVTRERRLAYSSVKAGLNGMTRALALELAPRGVLVNALCPGYVETELTRVNNSAEDLKEIIRTIPVGRLAQPQEMARMAAFLVSDENTYLTGQTLVVDGGFLLR
jgi:3-oxoacyl-[acyl-carrier protein] reductase